MTLYNTINVYLCSAFIVGKVFYLHGGQEQCDLKPSQFICEYNPYHVYLRSEWIQEPQIKASLVAAVMRMRWLPSTEY